MGSRQRGRQRLLSALAVASIAAALAAVAAASAPTVAVALKRKGPARPAVGVPVTLVASAKLPKGDHLLIEGIRAAGGMVKVRECLRSPCTGRWREADVSDMVFQALAIRRAGRRTTVHGRSRTVAVSWTAAPAPGQSTTPAVPAVAPGHYDGLTSQNELFAFDVSADAKRITGLRTGQINQSCDPPDYNLSGGYLNNWSGPLRRDGSFTLVYDGPGTVGGNAAVYHITIAGTVGAGTASGTLRDDVGWTENGTTYSCSSGDQTWSATKTG
jgi:hypothetical protein